MAAPTSTTGTRTATALHHYRGLNSASVGWAILGLFLVAWVALWVMYRMGDKGPHGWDAVNPLNIGAEFMTWSTRLKYAAAVATGAGAVVALVVNYRKQRDAEDGKFTARFADASAQLGSEAPAVRIAGVYALAALADEQADRARRQLCIDALCGYLRLPYDPQAGSAHTSTRTVERPIGDGGKTTTTDTYRPADREVRLTILRVIRDHLQDPKAAGTWCDHDLDFTGAVFDGGDFSGAVFSGGQVTFDDAVFSGGQVTFDDATFSGGQVTFNRATFSAGQVTFDYAVFSGGQVTFNRATFSAGQVTFDYAVFSGGQVTFDDAVFSGGQVTFDDATFSGGQVGFDFARFSGGQVTFNRATFSAGQVGFDFATFSAGQVGFNRTTFSGGQVGFDFARFSGGQVTFDDATFSGGQVTFDFARFSGGQVLRNGVAFRPAGP